MLADIKVNATVYVQPTSRSVVHSPHRLRIYGYCAVCAREQNTVGNWRTADTRYVSDCGSVFAFVLVVRSTGGEAGKAQLHKRRDHDACEIRAAVMREDIPELLLQVLQTHGFACEACDEIAHGLRRGTQSQVAKQVEQLFEHLPPTAARNPLAALHRRCRRRLSVL